MCSSAPTLSEPPKQRRKSRQRDVIFDELCSITSHPTAVELHDLVRKRLPSVSLGTVYRNLELLAQMGLIEKLEYSSGEARFDANVSEHDHLRCVQCGRVDDLSMPPLVLPPPEDHYLRGYELLGHRLEFIGLCPSCRQASASGRPPAARAASSNGSPSQGIVHDA
jgi:Fur family ferric uptake transcriptional regulator